MTDMAEIKTLIEQDARLTEELRARVDEVAKDVVRSDEVKKIRDELARVISERAAAEEKLRAELAEARQLAEEAARKAGRGVATTGDAGNLATEHRKAFVAWLRSHADDGRPSVEARQALAEIERKAVETGTPSAGGVAVPEEVSRDINRKLANAAVLRSLVKTVQVGTTDYRELVDKRGMAYGWIGETAARTITATSSLYEAKPAWGEIYAYPEASDRALLDILFDVESWLINSAVTAFGTGIDTAIVAGTGTDQPQGLLTTAPVPTADGSRADQTLQYVATGVAGAFSADPHGDLVRLVYTLRAPYRPGAVWVMNSMTAAQVRALRDSNGRPLWIDSLIAGQPSQLLGYEVRIAEAWPDVAAGSLPIAFGDFARAYTFAERAGLRITRDEVTRPGYVRWHIRRLVGGVVTNDDAVKLLKMSTT
jgi:HK97 family phage major capsid protein